MDLFVADTGEADLPVVLCLHSLFLDHTMFDELVAAARGRFRMVRPDFRGQGASGAAGARRAQLTTSPSNSPVERHASR